MLICRWTKHQPTPVRPEPVEGPKPPQGEPPSTSSGRTDHVDLPMDEAPMTPFARTKKIPFVLSPSKDPNRRRVNPLRQAQGERIILTCRWTMHQPTPVRAHQKNPVRPEPVEGSKPPPQGETPSTSSGRTDHVDLPMDEAPMTPFACTTQPPFVLSPSKDPAQIKFALTKNPVRPESVEGPKPPQVEPFDKLRANGSC